MLGLDCDGSTTGRSPDTLPPHPRLLARPEDCSAQDQPCKADPALAGLVARVLLAAFTFRDQGVDLISRGPPWREPRCSPEQWQHGRHPPRAMRAQ